MSSDETRKSDPIELGACNEKVRFDGATFTLTFKGISGKTRHSPVVFDARNVDDIEYQAAGLTKSGHLRFRLTGDIDTNFNPSLSETTVEIPAPSTKKSREEWERLLVWARKSIDTSETREPAEWVSARFNALASRAAERALASFDDAVYLTGLPESDAHALGHLIANGNRIGIGEVKPTRYVVEFIDVARATIDGGQSIKQVLLRYLKFGVFNLLGSGTGDVSYVSLELKQGTTVVYQVPDVAPQNLRGQLYPIFRGNGIATEEAVDDASISPDSNAAISVADELAKLAGLRGQGVLDEAEFSALKAKLLSKGY